MDGFVNETNLITIRSENDTQTRTYLIEANVTENVTYYEADDVVVFRKFLLISWLSTIALCITTVSFGIVSWTLIVKWRQFRNYVFTMVCFSGALFTMVSTLTFIPSIIFLEFITMMGVSSFVFWLLITSVIFYVDVVRIFSYNYDHVYLKSTVFAWGIPALILLIDHFYYINLIDWAMIGVSVVSVSLYIRVLYTLMRRAKVRGSSHMTIWKKIKLASFIFLGSGCAMMLPVLLANHVGTEGVWLQIIVFMFLLQLIAINLLFLMLKSHRSLWKEYLQRRRVRNECVNSLRRPDTLVVREVDSGA